MDNRKITHDIMNALERLRIMHDLARDQNFSVIPKEEVKADLIETIQKLKEDFSKLIDQ
jgi:galactitol-specific phosphotransferase system IIB component